MCLRDLSQTQLETILKAGVLAPSADNHHLFRFSILNDRILIKPSQSYRVANAQTRLLAWISFGAVVENMRIQATSYGMQLNAAWFPADEVICEIRLKRNGTELDPLVNAIRLRHTNRRFFSGPRMEGLQQTQLDNAIFRCDGVNLVWLDPTPVRKKALRLIRLAETERFRSHSLHAELFAALRFDVGYKASCEEGIPIGAAEIELPARPFFKLMRDWRIMRALNLFGTSALLGWRSAYLPALRAPHLGVVVADGDMQAAAPQAGRAFERLWLQANAIGLALQPFAAAALYARPEFEHVSANVRRELERGWAELVGRGTPVMVFRLGHARAPTVRSGRPPLAQFLASP